MSRSSRQLPLAVSLLLTFVGLWAWAHSYVTPERLSARRGISVLKLSLIDGELDLAAARYDLDEVVAAIEGAGTPPTQGLALDRVTNSLHIDSADHPLPARWTWFLRTDLQRRGFQFHAPILLVAVVLMLLFLWSFWVTSYTRR